MCGIANTMDFPERLEKRIASRFGNRRIVFK
jgi:Cdc6-like AAA superfamily ATPase